MAISSSVPHAFIPSSVPKLIVPDRYTLKKVLLFTRHGDRSQIAISMGTNFPENDMVTSIWDELLPKPNRLMNLKSIASFNVPGLTRSDMGINPEDDLYAGWDFINRPYGMLTDIGSQQLMSVGASLRTRYKNLLNNTNYASSIYCRSTNMCRTLLSLRSILNGLLLDNPDFDVPTSFKSVPVIISRPKVFETLYPQADGLCMALNARSDYLFGNHFLSTNIPGYEDFEKKISHIIGYEGETVDWLVVREVLTCHLEHKIPLPPGIVESDIDKAAYISSYMWGALFNVHITS
jgi:hypothetical protein